MTLARQFGKACKLLNCLLDIVFIKIIIIIPIPPITLPIYRKSKLAWLRTASTKSPSLHSINSGLHLSEISEHHNANIVHRIRKSFESNIDQLADRPTSNASEWCEAVIRTDNPIILQHEFRKFVIVVVINAGRYPDTKWASRHKRYSKQTCWTEHVHCEKKYKKWISSMMFISLKLVSHYIINRTSHLYC